MQRLSSRLGILVIATSVLASACGTPGGGGIDEDDGSAAPQAISTDIASLGPVTLSVWDQEVRGGQDERMRQLNAMFEEKYPNVTIDRTAKSFTDLETTVQLVVSGDDPPDVVQMNRGRQDMGKLVAANLLVSLDSYSDIYGWDNRYAGSLLRANSYTENAETWGAGDLYGLSQEGQIVGAFYNREMLQELGADLPTTFDEFEILLDTAKSAGMLPIQFGNLEGWPGIHEFQVVQNNYADGGQINDLIYGTDAQVSFDTQQTALAAETIQLWTKKGYFAEGFNGTSYDDAWKSFAEGQGLLLITGTWLTPDLQDAMGDNLGFFVLPTGPNDSLVTLGGQQLPFTITARSDSQDVAAAYLDFITSENAADVIRDTGGLIAMNFEVIDFPPNSVLGDVYTAWAEVNEADAIVPFLDQATPTMYDTSTAAIQELLATRTSPAQFAAALEKDHADFISTPQSDN